MLLLPLGTKSWSRSSMQRLVNQSFCQVFVCQRLSQWLQPVPALLPPGEQRAVGIGGDPVAGRRHAGAEGLVLPVQRHGVLGLIGTGSALSEVRPAKESEPV